MAVTANLKLVEIMELHGRAEVEEHVSEIRTLGAQFMENGMRNKFDGQLDITQRRAEPNAGKKGNNKLIKLC